MNQPKRQLSSNQSIDTGANKSRLKFDEKNLTYNCLEYLSNELFYEIFEYLDVYYVYKAFSNLNIRFQNLINCPSFLLRINFYTDSKSIIEQRYQQFIIPNRHRIRSFNLIGQLLIDEVFNHHIINSSFTRLELLILNSIIIHKLPIILSSLNSLPRLFSLIILMQYYDFNVDDIYQSILSLSTLKYSYLSVFNYESSSAIMPIAINQNVSTIKYLVMDHSCSVNSLISLLCRTPQLRHLICKRLIRVDENIREISSIRTPYLTYISIGICYINFSVFEIFIKKISSRLKELHIHIFGIIDYLDANRWKQLIEEHMPHLRKFYFTYEQFINHKVRYPSYTIINQFNSSFWIERKWFFELELNYNKIRFSIHPCRKEWFNFDEYMEIYTFSNQRYENIHSRPVDDVHISQLFLNIQLTIEDHIRIERNQFLIDKIIPSFNAIHFTYLNIHCNYMPISMLIKIIHLLPNINSLKVSSLPMFQLSNLSVKDTTDYLSVSTKNKITKVKLEKITEMEQIHFLINLCPRMQYFELDCMKNMNLEMVIKFVLIRLTTYMPNLFFLCINIPNANEKMIQNLSKTIDFKTFLDHYTIQRIGDKIFLQWVLQ